MYRLFVIGDKSGKPLNLEQIADYLNRLGIASPKKGKLNWLANTVGRMLKIETYAGVWHYGKMKRENGKLTTAPRDSWIAVDVPPIVDRDLWEAAQQRRAKRARNKNHKKHNHLLTGMLVCPECGYNMTVNISTKKYQKIQKYYYYRCNATNSPKLHIRKCTHKTHYRLDVVDAAIWQELENIFTNEKRLVEAMESYRAQSLEKATPLLDEIKTVEATIANAEKTLKNLVSDHREAVGRRHKQMIADDIERLEKQLDGLEASRDELKAKLASVDSTPTELEDFAAFAKEIKNKWQAISQDFESKRLFCQRIGLEVKLGTDEQGRKYAALSSNLTLESSLTIDGSSFLKNILSMV